MSNATKTSPPVYEEGTQTWKEYKKELMMWKTLTSLDANKLGPALYLALKGKPKEVIKDIDIDEIAVAGGLDKIVEVLDDVFKKDENQEAYLAYKTFEEFKRPKDMKVKDYIIKFESLHTKLKSLQMELPEGVKAYRLLHSANMSDEENRLCLATIKEFKYDDMKMQLMKICGDEVSCSSTGLSTMSIKQEPVFLSENKYGQSGSNRYVEERRFNDEHLFNDEYRSYDGHRFRNETENPVYYAENQGNRYNNRRPNRWNNRPWNQHRGNRRGGGSVRGRGYVTPKGELNPVGPDGVVSKCAVCESKYHWKINCPEIKYTVESKKEGSYNNTNIVGVCESMGNEKEINLYNVLQTSGDELDGLIGETIGMAVVDSGCSKTVAGKQWFELYKDTMEKETLENLKILPSQQMFKFGEGKSVKSEGKVKLPALIGSKKVTIETEIIKANIPMLLSKESMKTACTVINFNTDQIEMLGETHNLISTSSGHYAIPLTQSNNSDIQTTQNHVSLICKYDDISNDPKKIADKLHRQFCHCSANKLKQLIRNSEIWTNDNTLLDAVDTISASCQICKRYKKSPSIPVVGLPLASNFMDCVAMDLFFVYGKIILHLIDIFTRYSVAVARSSKSQNSIVDAIMKAWISYFGKPKRFIADNGGEFNNRTYRDMCDLFEIKILKTAAYSPWSNGLCERHNGVLEESIKKTVEETGCSVETATVWSVSAKNTLCNQSGFSSNQMLFGRNPNFPSVLNDKLTGLSCDDDLAYTVEENLKAMRAAREACIKAESSDKIKRALTHNVPSYNNEQFENGQKVYYKRKDTRWSGPAIVIGKDGKTGIVKHGGEMIRVHISRVIHVDKDQTSQDQHLDTDKSNKNSSDINEMTSKASKEKNETSIDLNSIDDSDSDDESGKENNEKKTIKKCEY